MFWKRKKTDDRAALLRRIEVLEHELGVGRPSREDEMRKLVLTVVNIEKDLADDLHSPWQHAALWNTHRMLIEEMSRRIMQGDPLPPVDYDG